MFQFDVHVNASMVGLVLLCAIKRCYAQLKGQLFQASCKQNEALKEL